MSLIDQCKLLAALTIAALLGYVKGLLAQPAECPRCARDPRGVCTPCAERQW